MHTCTCLGSKPTRLTIYSSKCQNLIPNLARETAFEESVLKRRVNISKELSTQV